MPGRFGEGTSAWCWACRGGRRAGEPGTGAEVEVERLPSAEAEGLKDMVNGTFRGVAGKYLENYANGYGLLHAQAARRGKMDELERLLFDVAVLAPSWPFGPGTMRA